MNRFASFLIVSACALAMLASCETARDAAVSNQPVQSVDLLRKALQAGETPAIATPFALRGFMPWLDGKWIGNAVSYGCYRKGQAPGVKGPSEEEILQDLTIVTRYWNLIRVYGSDDDAERVLRVIRRHKLPLRVMLGVWLANESDHPETRAANIEQVLRCIKLANEYTGILAGVTVGNETQVFWSAHRMQTDNLIRYIRAVRNNISVPVSTADDYNFWNKPESRAVAAEVDFIVTHIYPLWNGKTLGNAIPWLDETFQSISAAHPGKQVVLGETGWATNYNAAKTGPGEQGTLIKGEVSISAQAQYLNLHNEWVNANRITTFLFEAFDESWKGGGAATGPDEVEKHWGVFYEDRTPKESFESYLNNRQTQ